MTNIMTLMPQNTLPDYHFLLIASNLDAEWFFEASRAYWERFRPTVVNDLTLISIIPDNLSIAVTVVARRDRIAEFGVELSKLAPDALFDPVVFDFFEDTQETLDLRAQLNQPFGVPLLPTETPTPGPTAPPFYPTPGPIAAPQNDGNAAPQVPTPDFTNVPDAPVPTQADDAGEPPTPIFPTPGPITGS